MLNSKCQMYRLSLIALGLFLSLVLGVSEVVYAKEMPQRLGVGIKNNTREDIPSLAALYNVNGDFAIYGGFGLDTKKDFSKSQGTVGIRHIIFQEPNLHFYTSGQASVVNYENPNGKESGFEVGFLLGTEFFFAGLENVGFSFEGGVGLSTVDSTRVYTIADHPFRAGILFYF